MRRRQEADLRRTNRTLRTISVCNQALARAADEADLMREICAAMVHEGGCRMAWIGFAEDDPGKTVRPVAQAGFDEGYVAHAGLSWAADKRGRSPAGRAIRTGRPVVCRDLRNDPAFAPWRKEALKRGYAAFLMLPLRAGEGVRGVLGVYAAAAGVFDAAEVRLLSELADDLAHGIQAGRRRAGHRRTEEALRHSENCLQEAQRIAHLGNWELDLVHNTLRWSDEIFRIFEIDPRKFSATYEAFLDMVHPDDRNLVSEAYTSSVRDRVPYDIVHRLRMKDGRIKHVNERCETFYDPAGRPLRSVGTVLDVTERQQSEEARRRISRTLRTLSSCNQALIHAATEQELLAGICRVIVHEGGYKFVWVGYAENDERKTVRPMASAGDGADYLGKADITWADEPRGQGPTGTVIRTGQPALCRDLRSDPRFGPWCGEAGKRGCASSIVLPLLAGKTVFGAVHICAAEPNAFDPEEAALLKELADDLAYGIGAQREHEQRRKAEERLRLEVARGQALLDLYERSRQLDERKLYDLALEHAVHLTGSTVGFLHRVSEDQKTIILTTWNRAALQQCTAGAAGAHYSLEEAGNWVDCVRLGRPVIYNDFATAPNRKGLPAGHAPVHRFMSIPVFEGGKVRIIFGVGNKAEDYDEHDTVQLKLVAGELQKILAQRQAEEAQRQAGAYNRSLIEASLDPLVTIGPEGKITDVNTATETGTGRSRAELIGTDFSDYFTEPEQARAGYRQVFRDGLVRDYPLELRHRDGRIMSVLYNASVYRDEHGAVIGVFAAARDVTERQRMEAELIASENRYRRLFETSRDGLLIVNADTGTMVDVNPFLCEQMGLAREQFVGKKIWEIGGFRAIVADRAGFAELVRQPAVRFEDKPLVAAGGRPVDVEFFSTVYPVGRHQVMKCSFRDITERKRAERALQASREKLHEEEARFRALVEKSHEAVTVLDRQGRRIYASPTTERVLGYTTEELIGRSAFEFVHPDDRDRVEAVFAELARETGGTRSLELRFLRRDGSLRWFEVTASNLLHIPSVQGIVNNYRDITERKEAEAARRKSEERFRNLTENTSDWIWEINEQGVYTYASPRIRDLLGYEPEEMLGRSPLSLMAADEAARVREVLTRLSDARAPIVAFENLNLHKDGHVVVLETSAVPVFDAKGGWRGYRGIDRDITGRKEAEKKLQLFRTLIERSSEGIYVADAVTGRLLDVNECACRELGFSREELLAGTLSDVAPDVDPAYFAAIKARLLEFGHAVFETQGRRKDGTVHPIEVSLSRVVLDREYMLAMVRDITARRAAEAALQESEAKFSVAFNLSPVALTLTTADSSIFRDVNEIFLKDTGFARGEVIDRSLTELDLFVDPAERLRLRDAVRLHGRAYGMPCVLRMKSGQLIHCLISSCGISIGGEQCILSAILDITERKQTEEELQFRNVLLSTQQEASIDGILVVDEHTRILSLNRRFAEMWGLPAELVAGKPDEAVLQVMTRQLADPPAFLRRVQHLYARREETGRDEILLADGRVFDRYTAPMLGPQQRYYGRVWYFRDITDRKKLEAQFLQAQKMEAFGQLAGGVAHDFNNILGVMLMQLNLLQMEQNLGGKLVSGLAELERHALRGAGLTRQLLMFSRRQTMEPRVLDLNLLLDDISRMLRRVLGEDIAFELRKSATPLWIEADAGMVEQVVMNLCINARDAMHHGGRLTIETRHDECLPSALGPAQKVACLAVSDTGCGMDAATKSRIFEPFFTTKPAGKGTGLGLATVYGIVQQHRGWVEVDSAPDQGSTFRVFFPLREQQRSETDEAALHEAPGGQESILLVEDEESLRSTMTACLRHAGYQVVAAANGVEALQQWEEGRRGFDLLLTDYRMPEGLTGLQLATQLMRMKDGLKVIVMSGYIPDNRETVAPWPAEITRIAKPFEVRLLLQTVRQILDAK